MVAGATPKYVLTVTSEAPAKVWALVKMRVGEMKVPMPWPIVLRQPVADTTAVASIRELASSSSGWRAATPSNVTAENSTVQTTTRRMR